MHAYIAELFLSFHIPFLHNSVVVFETNKEYLTWGDDDTLFILNKEVKKE